MKVSALLVVILCWSFCLYSADAERKLGRRRRFIGDWFRSIFTTEACFEKENIGCFDSRRPFNNVQFLPKSPSSIGTKFLLYSRASNVTPKTLDTTAASVKAAIKGKVKDTKVLIHGYRDRGDKQWILDMKDALLKRGDFNVIIVNWENGADGIYHQSVANTRVVGALLANQLQALRNVANVSYDGMHLIGHSLGAHIAGYAGDRVRGLGRITGLDPAGPNFERFSSKVRLDATDAKFVDVIHTNGERLVQLGFGLERVSGDVDFYPNGGSDQPGCRNNFGRHFANLFTGAFRSKDLARDVACSHLRAIYLFTESINSACKFAAYPCDSERDFEAGRCDSCGAKKCPVMGYDAVKGRPSGTFYLSTRSAAPYCRK